MPSDFLHVPRIPLFISREIGEVDYLSALEYGRVVDGQPAECFRYVGQRFRYCLDPPCGRVIGFELLELPSFDIEAEEYAALWEPPRFDAPLLGLSGATAGEIVLAARATLADECTMNRAFFHAATGAEGEEAAGYWRACLECGDMTAHYGLGYTLYELEDLHGAYRHLRRYTELAPTNAWAWCWYGKACSPLGELAEAQRAFRKAIELEEAGGPETDAPELLDELLETGSISG